MISKEKVRKKALQTRNALHEQWRSEQSREIIKRVLASPLYQKAKVVLSYYAIRSEVDTAELNRRVIEDGKQLYLPKTNAVDKTMCFYQVHEYDSLKKGNYGIPEPRGDQKIEGQFEDGSFSGEDVLMIMPGVAFDEKGNRMGYGGGFYDRYLHKYGKMLTSVMIVFEEQKSLIIPVEHCDVKPDHIVTQNIQISKERNE